jgi:hypothetical protein
VFAPVFRKLREISQPPLRRVVFTLVHGETCRTHTSLRPLGVGEVS